MIENTTTSIVYTSDGVQRYWTIPFAYLDRLNDVKVAIQNHETGEITQLAYLTDFVIQPNAPQVVGLVTAAAEDDKILISRRTANTQEEDSSQHTFTSPDVERMADKLTMIVQEHSEKLDRCLAVSNFSSEEELDADAYLKEVQDYAQAAEDSASEAASSAASVSDALAQAQEYASQAQASANDANSSKTAAASSASSAAASSNTASTYASNALSSANSASSYASSASSSATTATTKANEAATSATNSANSASDAAGYASTASSKAAEAATSAGNASSSATAAATSASNASNSASSASTSAGNAATSASNASNYKDAAATSATAASGSATAAAASATSANTALTQAQGVLSEIQSYRRVDVSFVAGTASGDYSGSLTVFDTGLDIDLTELVVDVLVNGKGYQKDKSPADYSISGDVITFASAVPSGSIVQFRVNATTRVVMAGTVDVDGKISDHNESATAHSDIRTAITNAQSAAVSSATSAAATDAASKVSAHNSSDSAHSDIRTLIAAKASSADLATVATSGSYNDLSNKPTIPTVNNSTITIKKNNETVDSFTTNASAAKSINITVPTKTSDLTNDSGFLTQHQDISGKANTADLATVATTGSYTDLSDKPSIPTVNNSTITIQKNGTNVDSFTTNQSSAKNINIIVPTKTSDLTNDAAFVTSSAIPTKVSDLTNDSGFLSSVPAATSSTLGGVKVAYDSTTQTLTISVS